MAKQLISKFCVLILLLLIVSSQANENPLNFDGNDASQQQLLLLMNNLQQRGQPPCEEWQTVTLTVKDVKINPIKKNMQVTGGNLKGHTFTFNEIYDWNTTVPSNPSARACVCNLDGLPCVPLCCKSDEQASVHNGKLSCLQKKDINPSQVLNDFKDHLVLRENLGEHGFVIVHHEEESLKPCANDGEIYTPGVHDGQYQLVAGTGKLNAEGVSYDASHYCFMAQPDTNEKRITFEPLLCQKVPQLSINPAGSDGDDDIGEQQLMELLMNNQPRPGTPPCKEWETVKLTLKDVEVNPAEKNIKVIVDNLKGRKFTFNEIYDWNTTVLTNPSARACVCNLDDLPCVPLCCKSDEQASVNNGKLSCVQKKDINPSQVLNDFKEHLVVRESLGEHGFVVVHHGKKSLQPCANNDETYLPGVHDGKYELDAATGELKAEGVSYDAGGYCFMAQPDKKEKIIKFEPLFCQKASKLNTAGGSISKQSGGSLATPFNFIIYAIASVNVLFLVPF